MPDDNAINQDSLNAIDDDVPSPAPPTIDDDIPPPPANSRGQNADGTPFSKYLFHELKIGQSVSWPLEDRNAISSRISQLHRRGAERYQTGLDPKDVRRVRVWRIADASAAELAKRAARKASMKAAAAVPASGTSTEPTSTEPTSTE